MLLITKGGNLLTILLTITFNKLPCEEPSFFFITSCHWTEEELKTFFGTHFNVKTVLPTPEFQFGGATGSTVTSIQIDDSTIKDKKLNLQILQRELYEKELDGIMDVLKMPSEDRVDTNILPMIKKLLEKVDTDHYTNLTSIIFSRKSQIVPDENKQTSQIEI